MSDAQLHIVPLYVDGKKRAYTPHLRATMRDPDEPAYGRDVRGDDFVGYAVILGWDLTRRVVYASATLAERGLAALQEMGIANVQAMFSRMK